MSKRDVPAVSENTEGRPWFEWSVAGLVILSAVLAFFGLVAAATIILASTSIVCASLRVSLRGRSPWKVRSHCYVCEYPPHRVEGGISLASHAIYDERHPLLGVALFAELSMTAAEILLLFRRGSVSC